ncbi:MAG: HAD-IIIA family hydrolase [Deltaproteobacteria bacterium]|nr:HAD-IIIA family hydrolase [Deltaproteobacteria bacterium]
MISIQDLEQIHAMMKSAVSSGGGEIKDIFFCPHSPDDGCDCRKPKPGMIYQAQGRFNIDISTAVMVGDSAKDIECARNAGCGHTVLVRTGNGILAEKVLAEKKIFPDRIVKDLYDAVRWIIDQS